MFKARPPLPDLSAPLREAGFFKPGARRAPALALRGDITALAHDAGLSLLALGTDAGTVAVYGADGFRFTIPVTLESRQAANANANANAASAAPRDSARTTETAGTDRTAETAETARTARTSSSPSSPSITWLTFHGTKLVAIDARNTLYQYDLGRTSEPAHRAAPALPVRDAAASLGDVRALETGPAHGFVFLGLADGSVRAWDTALARIADWRIDSLWDSHEDRLRRSGVNRPTPRTRSPVTALAHNPRDLNELLIGYSGGVALYDFRAGAGVRFFEAVHAPGSPGGGSYADAERLWSERSAPVTALAWRDDGLVFCAGHGDGCLSFWACADDKPLTVRTLTHEDVHIADAEALVAAGALRDQLAAKAAGAFAHAPVTPAAVADREPVFRLAWASFSPGAGGEFAAPFAQRGESLLLVLGGQAAGEKPGISVLQLPAYAAPAQPKAKAARRADGLSRHERAAFRASVNPTGATAYRTRTPPEDFVLLASSPHFGGARDAAALAVLLTPETDADPDAGADPGAGGRARGRELEAYAFPPLRADAAPPVLGRKDFALPGEGDVMAQAQSQSQAAGGVVRRTSTSANARRARFPWSAPERASTLSSRSVRRARDGALAVPSGIWRGARALLGARIAAVPPAQFARLLAGLAADAAGADGSSGNSGRIPLRGGRAVPDLRSAGAPDPAHVHAHAQHADHELMVSWHADATVRFHDVSAQLLLHAPLAFEYPQPLPHLTVDVGRILRDTHGEGAPRPAIVDAHLAPESLECAVALASGQIVVVRFGEAGGPRASMSPSEGTATEEPIAEEPAPTGEEGEDGEEPVERREIEKDNEHGKDEGKPSTQPFAQASAQADEKAADAAVDAAAEQFGSVDLDDVSLEDVSLEEEEEEEAAPRLYRGWDGRFDDRTPSPPPPPPPPPATQVLDLSHLAKLDVDGFRPVALFELSGCVSALALSDIGFLAAGYGAQLVLMDMRGPRVMHVEVLERRVCVLRWAVCGVGHDGAPSPRLFAVCDGATRVYPLANAQGQWAAGRPATFASLEAPVAAFVLDPETGAELCATPAAFAAAMQPAPPGAHAAPRRLSLRARTHCVYVAVARHAVRATANVTGDRLAKAHLNACAGAAYVARNGGHALVALTPGHAECLSVPRLERITRLALPGGGGGGGGGGGQRSFTASGDFLDVSEHGEPVLGTLFDFRKPGPPRLDPLHGRVPPGPPPQPLSAGVFSWMWANAPLTGAGLDALVGGPGRAVPKPPPQQQRESIMAWAEPPAAAAAPRDARRASRRAPAAAADAAHDSPGAGGIYAELQAKLRQRDEVIGRLEESAGQMASTASAFVDAARKAAAAEAGRSGARAFFKF